MNFISGKTEHDFKKDDFFHFSHTKSDILSIHHLKTNVCLFILIQNEVDASTLSIQVYLSNSFFTNILGVDI